MATVAENLVAQVAKISQALDQLTRMGLPESIVILYVQKKTRLPQRDIKAVFDALKDFNKVVKPPS